jgi:hypothetical protein
MSSAVKMLYLLLRDKTLDLGAIIHFVCLRDQYNVFSESIQYSIKMKVNLSLYLTNLTLRYEGVWGSGCIDPRFLDLDTS